MSAAPTESITEHRVLGDAATQLFIDGVWRDSISGDTFDVLDPATGKLLAAVSDAGVDDARAALDAAHDKQVRWAATSPQERADILRRAYDRMLRNADDLALLMTLEMGKSLAESRAEVLYAAQFLRWSGEEASRISGRWMTAPDGKSRIVTMRQPVGPCLLITAWNFPLALAARKVAAAIAAGCTMVLKPADQTPLCALAFAELLRAVGLPAGVLNVVTTTSAPAVCRALMLDPRLRKVSFTGSTLVGRALMEQAAPGLLRVSFELGGNAPFIVFEDADLDSAVEGALVAKLRNIGEACTAVNRFFVHESVAEDFTNRLVEKMSSLQLGRGTDPTIDIGPIIDERQRARVSELVVDAVEHGAELRLGGIVPKGPGTFYPPTVLTNVDPSSRLLAEEIFGPVAAILTFTDEEEVLAAANDTEYGLVAYVYTQDVDRAVRMTERLEFGMVAANRGIVSNPAAPFGGIKASGLGREGGPEGIEEYLQTKYLSLNVPTP